MGIDAATRRTRSRTPADVIAGGERLDAPGPIVRDPSSQPAHQAAGHQMNHTTAAATAPTAHPANVGTAGLQVCVRGGRLRTGVPGVQAAGSSTASLDSRSA